MRMAITRDDTRAISIPLCPQTVIACGLSAMATPWEPLQLFFHMGGPNRLVCSLPIPKSHLLLTRFPVLMQQRVVAVGGGERIRLSSRGVSGYEHFAK